MDFVEWCDLVLKTCVEVMKTSPQARTIGVDEYELAQALSNTLGIAHFGRQEQYHKTTYYSGMFNAIKSLKAVELIENNERSNSHWKISRSAHQHLIDRIPFWSAICQEQIETSRLGICFRLLFSCEYY